MLLCSIAQPVGSVTRYRRAGRRGLVDGFINQLGAVDHTTANRQRHKSRAPDIKLSINRPATETSSIAINEKAGDM